MHDFYMKTRKGQSQMMFMGSENIIFVMFYVSLSPLFIRWTLAVENSTYDPHSLDDFVHDYAQKAVRMPHAGTLYNISVPSNYSGMEISFVRLRSASFWVRGTNSSLFHIPPRIIPLPFVKRLDMVFQNLGNWSSYYYNVQNYTFVTPIIGLATYNATNSSANRSLMLDLSLHGDPILVRFPNISLEESEKETFKCVRFDTNGTTEFGNVTVPNLCKFRSQGHFSIVVPSLQQLPPWEEKREEKWKWKWWVIVFGVGVGGGSVVLVLVGILVWKMVRVKKIEGMEKQAEKSEALDTVWVGRSKMPSASGIRTQPVLEDDYIP